MLSGFPESPSSKKVTLVISFFWGSSNEEIPAFLKASEIIFTGIPSTPSFPSADAFSLRFSFPKISGIYIFIILPLFTAPFRKPLILKPALSESVRIIIPVFSA